MLQGQLLDDLLSFDSLTDPHSTLLLRVTFCPASVHTAAECEQLRNAMTLSAVRKA